MNVYVTDYLVREPLDDHRWRYVGDTSGDGGNAAAMCSCGYVQRDIEPCPRMVAALVAALGVRPEHREALDEVTLVEVSGSAEQGTQQYRHVGRWIDGAAPGDAILASCAPAPVQPVTDEATAVCACGHTRGHHRNVAPIGYYAPPHLPSTVNDGSCLDCSCVAFAAVPVPVVTEPAEALLVGNVEVAAWLASDEALKIAAETDQARCPEQPCPMPRLHRDAARAILTALSTALSSEEYRTP